MSDEDSPLLHDAVPLEKGFESSVSQVFGDACLWGLKGLSAMTMMAATLLLAVNLYALFWTPEQIRVSMIRVFNLTFGILIILGEVERPQLLLDYFKFLTSWPLKGLFIAFVGLLTLNTNDSILQTICALITFSIGGTYFLLGLCCLPLRCRFYYKRNQDFPPPEAPPPVVVVQDTTTSSHQNNAPSWMDPDRD